MRETMSSCSARSTTCCRSSSSCHLRVAKTVTDRCEDVANTIEGIVLENSLIKPGSRHGTFSDQPRRHRAARDYGSGLRFHERLSTMPPIPSATIVSTRVLKPIRRCCGHPPSISSLFLSFSPSPSPDHRQGHHQPGHRRSLSSFSAPWSAPSCGTSSPGTTAFPRRLPAPDRRAGGRGDRQGVGPGG